MADGQMTQSTYLDIDGLPARVTALETTAAVVAATLTDIINSGAKNLLNVWSQTSQTISGITWTINNDGTVRAQGTATADSVLYIWRNAFPPPAIDFDITISGLPAGASDTTYDYVYTSTATGSLSITDTREFTRSIAETTTRFALRVYSGQNVDIVFSPMICRSIFYITQKFVPYSPTNAELYKMLANGTRSLSMSAAPQERTEEEER